MPTHIEIIHSSKIDVTRWSALLQQTKAPVYCQHVYLNTMCSNWFGLIINNYEAVIPLPIKQKAGIKYLYSVPFIQQLGLVGNTKVDWQSIEDAIKNFVSYGDIYFNHQNKLVTEVLPVQQRTNFIIDLKNSYEEIAANYSGDVVKNLAKASKLEGLMYQTDSTHLKSSLNNYYQHYSYKIDNTTEADMANFENLCVHFLSKNNCLVRRIEEKEAGVLASAIILKNENRLYNLANVITKEGRAKSANYLLIDGLIKEFAGSNHILDFEGSDLPGVKEFYQKFGATNQPYFHWHFNNLPWHLKWLKS